MATKKQASKKIKLVNAMGPAYLLNIVTQLTVRCDQYAQRFEDVDQWLKELQEAICPKVAARLTALEKDNKFLRDLLNQMINNNVNNFTAIGELKKQGTAADNTMTNFSQRLAKHIAETDKELDELHKHLPQVSPKSTLGQWSAVVEAARRFVAYGGAPLSKGEISPYATLFDAVKALDK
jgi:exonuclease VII large subunit